MQSSLSTEQDLTTIYMSVEVSRSSWVVGIYCPATDNKIGIHKLEPSAANDLIKLAHKAQGRAGPGSRVVLCYEISYEGFWLARYLAEWAPDFEVVVIDPASLQVDRRAKTVKTDRIDATRMIRALKAWCAGDSDALSRVRVPSMADEDRRRLLRERDALVAERRRLCNRIRSLLSLHGVFDLKPLKKDFLSVLSTVMTGCGTQFPPRARAEIERIHARMKLVCAQIAEVEKLRDTLVQSGQGAEAGCVEAKAATLTRLHGIGNNDATLLSTEVFSRDFRNRRQLGSWAGLTSAPWSSGAVDHDQGITKSGPARVRKHLVQMAWRWLLFQPQSTLSVWFHERTSDGHGRNRRRMIIALARKLLVALWRLATEGVVPEGAIIR